MRDFTELKPGDRIRLLRVPEADLAQRKREVAANSEMAGWTADTIERIIATTPIVTIDRVDEYGHPWFDAVLTGIDGEIEEHSLNITDNDSWEHAD